MAGLRWTQEDTQRLVRAYRTATSEELAALFPGRSVVACRLRAQRLGMRYLRTSPQGSLAPLLAEEPIAAYWMGFLMADGSFTDYRLVLTVSIKDRGHLVRFAGWLGPSFVVRTDRDDTVASVSCQDRVNVPLIRSRFDIKNSKTYHPPQKLPYAEDDLLRCWLVGFIDGDGTIGLQSGGRRGATLSTVSHISWLELLTKISLQLGFGKVGTRRAGVDDDRTYATLSCTRHTEVVELRRFATAQSLPVLERKWSRVDFGYKPRGDLTRAIERLLGQGLRPKQIVSLTGCSYSHVGSTRQRLEERGQAVQP